MKILRKPIAAEAIRYDGTYRSEREVLAFTGHWAFLDGGTIRVTTRHGLRTLGKWDWLVRFGTGDYRVCDPDEFEREYEPLTEGMIA